MHLVGEWWHLLEEDDFFFFSWILTLVLFLILLEYSLFTMLLVSGRQQSASVIDIHIIHSFSDSLAI